MTDNHANSYTYKYSASHVTMQIARVCVHDALMVGNLRILFAWNCLRFDSFYLYVNQSHRL